MVLSDLNFQHHRKLFVLCMTMIRVKVMTLGSEKGTEWSSFHPSRCFPSSELAFWVL